MDEGKQNPLQGSPFSRLFILEVAFILLLLALTYYVFGFSYSFREGPKVISFPGMLNISNGRY